MNLGDFLVYGVGHHTSQPGNGEPAASNLDQPIIHPCIQYPVPVNIEPVSIHHQPTSSPASVKTGSQQPVTFSK